MPAAGTPPTPASPGEQAGEGGAVAVAAAVAAACGTRASSRKEGSKDVLSSFDAPDAVQDGVGCP